MGKRILDDLSRWRIENLARFGFSMKYIASVALDKALDRVDRNEACLIATHLHRVGIKVTDWRNGRTAAARQTTREAIRAKRKQKKRA